MLAGEEVVEDRDPKVADVDVARWAGRKAGSNGSRHRPGIVVERSAIEIVDGPSKVGQNSPGQNLGEAWDPRDLPSASPSDRPDRAKLLRRERWRFGPIQVSPTARSRSYGVREACDCTGGRTDALRS